ncbi:ABC transporter substrate-binding protein [Arthrobacter sp. SDTb3-6]|uniref:ABC transporter substrate-binding protein n=1 Tax=Arthrobacter sp. SDTb3-6 TaxID=2713571 RepID=UPI00159DDF64|nr:ABC transporter substrate-binding protein [Arthrobacter sp. SDTb3-6]NVN00051.1 ABC transporter substrate-binding protein [Arthrobacter sp. SDTb3-6]
MQKSKLIVPCLAIALLVSACSPGTGGTAATGQTPGTGSSVQVENAALTSSVKVNESARKLLPAAIRDAGVLKVGGETSLPPYLFLKEGKLTGIEANIMDALGKSLGLKVEVTNTKFAAMVTGLASQRFDVAMSDFSDTVERQKQVTFIDYTQSGQILVVAAGNPKGIKTLADLCGKSAAGPSGSLSVELAKQQSAKCAADGKAKMDVQQYPTGAETQLALQNGRTDAMAIDYAIGSYNVEQVPDKIEMTGDPFALGFHGAAVRPADKDLQAALEAGLTGLIADGTYKKILDQWKVPQMAMDKVLINGTKK